MRLENMSLSCGVMELAGLTGSKPETIAKFIALGKKDTYGHQGSDFWDEDEEICECDCEACEKCENKVGRKAACAMIVFSDRATTSPGARFATWCQRKFGNITASKTMKNPNTGNQIVFWVLHVNDAFLKHLRAIKE